MRLRSSYEIGEFGKLCRAGRAALQMTRPEMAKTLKQTMVQVTAVEAGRVKPSEYYLARVTGLLGLSTADVRVAVQKDDLMRASVGENVVQFVR